MKISSLCSVLFLASLTFVKAAGDTIPPTISAVTPAAGVLVNSDIVVVAGVAADTTNSTTTGTGTTATTTTTGTAGVARVEYRLSGDSKWRRATLTAPSTGSTTFVFTFKLGKGKSTIVLIRARDVTGNESDILGREIKRSHLRRSAG